MNIKLSKISNLKKIAIGTAAAIGLSTMGFAGLTQSVQAAAIDKFETVPTVYSSTASDVNKAKVPDGYVKANYKIIISEFSGKPAATDITAEEAAELGAQSLWKVFKADMSGRTIQMEYVPVRKDHPRAEWFGGTIGGDRGFHFSIDALTGEYRGAGIEQKYFPGNVDIGMDMALMKNPGQYSVLAKEIAEKRQLVSGKIASVEYGGQGYSMDERTNCKNATIGIIVTSKNGEQAKLEFSKVNQEFLNVMFDREMKDFQEFAKQAEEQAKKNAEKRAQKKDINSQDSESKLVAD